jgi:hypothetical protein
MPYDVDSPPSKVKGLSKNKQRQWVEVFNSCYAEHKDDGKCHAMAWGVVKKASMESREAMASRIASEITASATVGSRMRVIREVTTKGGMNFKQGDEVRLKGYEDKDGRYMVRFEADGDRSLRLPVVIAYKVIGGFPKPPSTATMQKWSMDGVAKAVDGSRIEPDGVAPSGAPSWLLVMGLI